MTEVLQKVKEAQKKIATLKGKDKDKILLEMADALEKEAKIIIEENKKDLDYAKSNNISDALIDRLLLNETRIKSMATALREIATLKNPVGRILEGW